MSPHMSCCILCGLDGAFGSKADFCLCYEAVVLILKMASFSPGCELDDQAYLCFLKAVTLFMWVGCDIDSQDYVCVRPSLGSWSWFMLVLWQLRDWHKLTRVLVMQLLAWQTDLHVCVLQWGMLSIIKSTMPPRALFLSMKWCNSLLMFLLTGVVICAVICVANGRSAGCL